MIMDERAEESSKYWAERLWCNNERQGEEDRWPEDKYGTIATEDLGMDERGIMLWEVKEGSGQTEEKEGCRAGRDTDGVHNRVG